jgi:transposase
MVYFNQGHHHIPLERTAEIIENLHEQSISEGTIVAFCNQMSQQVGPIIETAKVELESTTVTVHFDETGGRINGKLCWFHVVCTAFLTFYAIHPKRGSQASDVIGIFSVFRGTAMHDASCSYFQYEAVSNALWVDQHLRDLIFIEEQYHQVWAADMKKLLLEIKKTDQYSPPE